MTITEQGWATEIVSGETKDGMELREVRFWTSAARQRDGLGKHRITAVDGDRLCDLMNNFKMQIRTNHQRTVTRLGDRQEPDGYIRHVDGLWVPQRVALDEKLLDEFLTANDLPLSGYKPWMFENYAGVDEPLNGMWQRERYTLDLLALAETNIENYVDVAIREQWENDKRGTTLNLQVGASDDDAREKVDGSLFSSTVDFLSMNSAVADSFHSGIRFEPAIAQAATVDAADIQVWPRDDNQDDANITITAEDVDNAADFTATADVVDRVDTTASEDWIADAIGFGAFKTSPEIKTVIQEVVDRGSWVSANGMMVLCRGKTDLAKVFIGSTYDDNTAQAAKLDITFTVAGVANPKGPLGHPLHGPLGGPIGA